MLRVKETIHLGLPDGTERTLTKGDLFEDGDELVKNSPDLFEKATDPEAESKPARTRRTPAKKTGD